MRVIAIESRFLFHRRSQAVSDANLGLKISPNIVTSTAILFFAVSLQPPCFLERCVSSSSGPVREIHLILCARRTFQRHRLKYMLENTFSRIKKFHLLITELFTFTVVALNKFWIKYEKYCQPRCLSSFHFNSELPIARSRTDFKFYRFSFPAAVVSRVLQKTLDGISFRPKCSVADE